MAQKVPPQRVIVLGLDLGGGELGCILGMRGDIVRDPAWHLSNSRLLPWPVGNRLRNPWGLYDMLGNVRELCLDRYSSDYYAESPVENPTGPATGELRVVRGSCFMELPPFARSAWRGRCP